MSALVTGLASGLLVVFLAWAAKSVFLSRRLFLIQPRLFDYTEFGTDTKILELTAFNGGSRGEEQIRVQLSPAFRYTILASNQAGLVVDAQGVMQLDRLAPRQDMTVVLTAEGGEFRKEHVIGISSKDTVGKIKDSLQDAQLTPAQNLGIGLMLLFILPAVGYIFGKFVVEEVWSAAIPDVASGESLKFEVTPPTTRDVSLQNEVLALYRESYSVDKVTRSGNLVTISIKLRNPFSERISVTMRSATPVADERPPGADYIVFDLLVFPGTEKEIPLIDFLPEATKPQIITLQVRIEREEDTVEFNQDITLI